ncbi:MAG: hypothetical protein ACR2IK_04975 [Chloroflexota bacterium]
MGALRWLPSLLLLLPWLLAPTAPSDNARIRDLVGPSGFRLLDWETMHLGERATRLWLGLFGSGDSSDSPSDADTLRAYFRAGSREPDLRPGAEAALERVVSSAYQAGGLTWSEPLPLARLFPPVLVALTPPPNVLVIAPRTALRVIGSSVLQPMDFSAQADLEASADSTGISSLVAPIGGLATYPSMVLEEDTPDRVLAAVAHEWLHQYLIFYPLGRGYWNNQETREINETTADLVGVEVGAYLATRLDLSLPAAGAGATGAARPPAFDFRGFMRETRAQTEQLLANGQVDDAEAYMRDRRDELQQRGFQVRKLNQAYFALYGSYGDGFAASPSNPIPRLLHTLRQRSSTLGEVIFEVRQLTTVAELTRAAG